MTKGEILDIIIDDENDKELQYILLADGFEEAFLGCTANNPIKAVYDYWICLDLLIQRDNMDFDNAIDSLDEFIEQDLGESTPTYIKVV